MKMALRTSLAFALLLTSARLGAQNVKQVVNILNRPVADAPTEPARAAPGTRSPAETKVTPIFFMRDRSRVAGVLRLEALAVQTRYGVLNIPRRELVSVRLVQRVDPAIRRKATALIKQLGDDDFDVREKAMDELRAVGLDARPLIQEATNSENEEVKNRAEILVEELEEQAKESPAAGGEGGPLHLKGSDDEIVTNRMTVKGRVLAEEIVIDSRYGELTVDIAAISAIAFKQIGPSSRKVDVLPRYQPPGSWLDTKFNFEAGQAFRIEATGIITVSNYSVSCGPAGTRQWGGNSWNNFAQLSLVGKIGKKGKPFVVGTSYKSKVKKGGRLYLAIVAFNYNAAGANGKYTVKIRALGDS